MGWHSSSTDPLYKTIAHGDLNILHEYMKNDMSPKTKNEECLTFLLRTVKSDTEMRYEICKLLLDRGTNINERDIFGMNALDYLLDKDYKFDRQLLVLFKARNADIECKDEKLCTPLMKAVMLDNFVAAATLLQFGANPNAVDNVGNTVLSHAANYCKNEDIIRLLLSYRVNVNDQLTIYFIVLKKKPEFLRILFENGAVFQLPDLKRLLSLQSPRRIDCIEVAECLLENLISNEQTIQTELLSLIPLPIGMEPSEFQKKAYPVLKHLVILVEGQGLSLPDGILWFIQGLDLEQDYDKLTQQIRFIKEVKKYEKYGIIYFDLLFKEKVQSMRPHHIQIISENLHLDCKFFPDFANTINRNIGNNVFKKNIKNEFHVLLHRFCKLKLPMEIICSICDFLSIDDYYAFYNEKCVECIKIKYPIL